LVGLIKYGRGGGANPDRFWTASAERSDDGAFAGGGGTGFLNAVTAGESGVALRFPPQSKMKAAF
jgi:hypothetical protein